MHNLDFSAKSEADAYQKCANMLTTPYESYGVPTTMEHPYISIITA
jgi:hypothetical protein